MVAALLMGSATLAADSDVQEFDVVIISNSSGGVGAALGAGRTGAKVALVEATPVLGGMLANGISNIDCYSYESLSGVFEEFRQSVKEFYRPLEGIDPVLAPRDVGMPKHIDGRSHAAHDPMLGGRWEPKVADQIFKGMVSKLSNVQVYYRRFATQAIVENQKLVGVVTETEKGERITFRAKVFVDATHEADVAAAAGVPFRVGREARSELEPHAGKVYFFNHTGEFLPGSTGEADAAIPSYGLRLCIQNFPPEAGDGHVLKTPPPDYDRTHYLQASYGGRPSMPNGKSEMNVNPMGNEVQEINWSWPNGTRQERAALYQRYKNHALGYLYYLQHELGKKHLGLPKDEFVDNDFVPHLVFTREARRIEGVATMSEADINPFILGTGLIPPHQTTSIAVGQYPIDAKPVRTKTDLSTPHKGEGDFYLVNVTSAFQVPYGSILPQKLDGLLVPVALSATHVAFSAVRMDPTWTVLGQAAGVAAGLSAKDGVTPRQLPLGRIQEELVKQQAKLVFYWDLDAKHAQFSPIQMLTVRGIATSGADRRFRPDGPLTRADVASLLVRAFKLWPSISNVHFTDVPHTHPAFREVETLFDKGVLGVFGIEPRWPAEGGYIPNKHAGFKQNNSFGEFHPDQGVTKAEFEKLLKALAGTTNMDPKGGQKPTGASDTSAKPEVADTSPVLTRAEACAILWPVVAGAEK